MRKASKVSKVSNYIYNSLDDHAGHLLWLLTEVSNGGSMY